MRPTFAVRLMFPIFGVACNVTGLGFNGEGCCCIQCKPKMDKTVSLMSVDRRGMGQSGERTHEEEGKKVTGEAVISDMLQLPENGSVAP